jgi:hypothetical protein
MKATLTFNLPEEQVEYEYTLNAARYKDALKDIMDIMRVEIQANHEYEYGIETGLKIDTLYDAFSKITEGLLDE